jgi:hypothetical protein
LAPPTLAKDDRSRGLLHHRIKRIQLGQIQLGHIFRMNNVLLLARHLDEGRGAVKGSRFEAIVARRGQDEGGNQSNQKPPFP